MNLKQLVGMKATEYIKNDMVVGLGTGSTAYYFVEELGRLIHEDGLKIVGVTTSERTRQHALSLGIPLKNVDEVDDIDVTVDGADEISADFQGLKGGGGAHLYEKIVADCSKQIIWIVDHSKMVEKLGAFPLPVEVIKYGSLHVFHRLEEKGYQPAFRKNKNGQYYLTDENNYIIDLHLNIIEDPRALGKELASMTGVVENGLFVDRVHTVLIGSESGVEVRQSNL